MTAPQTETIERTIPAEAWKRPVQVDDAPARQVMSAGATADPVKDYLKQINKVALLNAQQEVDLALRIEAGLFANEKIAAGDDSMDPKYKRELELLIYDGRRAKNHMLEPTCAWWSQWQRTTPAAACRSWT